MLTQCDCEGSAHDPGCPFNPNKVYEPGGWKAYRSTPKGWECPKCGRCYAPFVSECHECNRPNYLTTVP